MGSVPTTTVVHQLDTNELFLKTFADLGTPINRAHWSIIQTLNLRFPSSISDPLPYIRRAWLVLRDRHPKLGAELVTDAAGEVCLSTDLGPFDHEAWLSETFRLDLSVSDAHALFASSRYSKYPRCYWLPNTQELTMFIQHWIVDGIGSTMLGHRFLIILAAVLTKGLTAELSQYAEDEITPEINPPTGDELSRYLNDGSPDALRAKNISQHVLGPLVQGLPSIGLSIAADRDSQPPGPASHVAVSLEPKTSALVVKACKKLEISVNSALHTSLMRVVGRLPQHPMAHAYTGMLYINMRPRLPAEAINIATGSMVALQPLSIRGILPEGKGETTKSWAQLVKEVNLAYCQVPEKAFDPQDGSPLLSITDVNGHVTRAILTMLTSPLPPGLPPMRLLEYSSIGILENYVQREYVCGDNGDKIELLDIWKASDCIDQSALCHGYTFRDRLYLSAGFNGGYYDISYMRKILEDTLVELLTGLGIDN